MTRRRRFLSASIGFAAIPIMGIVSPLVALPAITSRYGAAAWAAVAIGQSLGAALATIVELGWGLNGPQRVARMSARNSYQTLRLSFDTKILVSFPAALIATVAAYFLAHEYSIDAALVALGSVTAALSAAWFFLGKSRPWLVVATDGLPRLLFLVAASIAIWMGAPLATYALLGLVTPSILAPTVALVIARRASERTPPRFRPRLVFHAIRAQMSALTARAASALYIALPVTLVSIAAPAAVPIFAAGERLMRIALAAIAIVPNAMQGWVGRAPTPATRWERASKAIWVNVALAASAAALFGALAPWASAWVFSNVATLDPVHAWMFAIVVFLVVISRATGGIGLVALRRVQVVALSAVVGGVVGVPLILVLSRYFGVGGAVLGEICAEACVLAVQLVGIRRAWRKRT